MYRPARDGALARALQVARPAAGSRWLPPVLLAAVVLDDALLLQRAPNYAVLGLLDEPAHLATSLVILAAIAAAARARGRRITGTFAAGLVLAGNLIDADHVPQVLGTDVLTAGTPRPYSHSLLTLGVLVAGWFVARRGGRPRWARFLAGAAVGVSGHLLRDLGTAPVALLWPADDVGLMIPHGAYLAVLAVATGLACLLPRRAPSPR